MQQQIDALVDLINDLQQQVSDLSPKPEKCDTISERVAECANDKA